MLRRAFSLAVLVAGLAVTLVSPAQAANQSVQVRDDVFLPARVAVKPGESVTWTNPGPSNSHNVMFDDGQFTDPASPLRGPWMSSPHTFMTAGTYTYHCHEHGSPGGVGMSGVVYVNDAGNVPPVAKLSVFPNPVQTGQTVDFNATSSSDTDGTIAKYEWDLDGNGSFETDTGAVPRTSRSYATPTTLTVKVRVTDDKGYTDERSTSVQINVAPAAISPAPSFVAPVSLADTTAASMTEYGVTNKVFAPGKGSTPTSGKAARKLARGTTFKYKLSEAATMKIDLQQLTPGRKKGSACIRPSAKLKKAKKCIRAVSQGTLTRTSHAGLNRVAFTGRVGGKTLKPGSYQAMLSATDAAGNVSARKTITFKIVRA